MKLWESNSTTIFQFYDISINNIIYNCSLSRQNKKLILLFTIRLFDDDSLENY